MAASVVALSSFAPAYAAFDGATLSGVEIIPQNDSYQVTLKADKNIQIQKYVTADNKVVLDLKGTKPANFVNTVYNNATKIDHVIIQPTSSDSIRIFLEGANVSGTKVSLDTSVKPVETSPTASDASSQPVSDQAATASISQVTDTNAISEQTKEAETVVLNKPVDSFRPFGTTYSESQDEEEDAVDSVQSGMVSFGAFKKVFSTHTLDWFLRLGMLVLLLIGGYKLLGNKKQKKVTIDLSTPLNNLKSREVNLHKTISEKRTPIGGGLSDLNRKPGYASASRYGLKEYQNSQVPPLGLNQGMSRQKFESRMPQAPRPQTTKTLLRKEMPRTLQTGNITRNDVNTAKLNMDGVKFLESMAQIYERSGRVDLAKGLHTSIIKAKTSNRAVS